jgi:molybdate transport system permease protein
MTLLAVVGAGFFIVPLVGLLGRTPWNRLPEILSSVVVRQALGLSLVTSLAATAVSALLGVPLAYLLARARFRGSSL